MKYRAKNVDGQYSEFSKELIFALGSIPSAPSTPVKDDALSSNTSIALHWNKITTDTLPVTGYLLYADSGLNDDFRLAYDGSNQPEQVSYVFMRKNLSNVLTYRFYVTAINFNGEGLKSSIAYMKACTSPIFIERPQIMDLTQTKISIQWKKPLNDGGCLVLGYRIYLDDGANGPFTKKYELTEPFTTAYDIDMTLGATIGATYRVKMGVWNRVGEVQSDSVALILASVPSTPNPPTSVSDGTHLEVLMSIPVSNGGSPIVSY